MVYAFLIFLVVVLAVLVIKGFRHRFARTILFICICVGVTVFVLFGYPLLLNDVTALKAALT